MLPRDEQERAPSGTGVHVLAPPDRRDVVGVSAHVQEGCVGTVLRLPTIRGIRRSLLQAFRTGSSSDVITRHRCDRTTSRKKAASKRPPDAPMLEDKGATWVIPRCPTCEAEVLPFSYVFQSGRFAHESHVARCTGLVMQGHSWVLMQRYQKLRQPRASPVSPRPAGQGPDVTVAGRLELRDEHTPGGGRYSAKEPLFEQTGRRAMHLWMRRVDHHRPARGALHGQAPEDAVAWLQRTNQL